VTEVIAHRGASRDERENTLAAFRAAAAQGADGVELDVRRTADGRLVVHHDAHLPDGRAVVSLTWDDLPDHVPDLAAALDACQGLATVNVEIKNLPDDVDFDPTLDVVDRVVGELAERRATDRAALLVSCFHLPSLARVRAADPDLTTGWLVIGPGIGPSGERFATVGGDRREVLAATVSAAAAGGHRALHPHHAFVTPELVSAAHAAGLAVNAWTVDEVDRIRWLADRGVDAVITNVPAVARRALGRARSPD
jgi:glycerophosphoryl diester phosphodiesterase